MKLNKIIPNGISGHTIFLPVFFVDFEFWVNNSFKTALFFFVFFIIFFFKVFLKLLKWIFKRLRCKKNYKKYYLHISNLNYVPNNYFIFATIFYFFFFLVYVYINFKTSDASEIFTERRWVHENILNNYVSLKFPLKQTWFTLNKDEDQYLLQMSRWMPFYEWPLFEGQHCLKYVKEVADRYTINYKKLDLWLRKNEVCVEVNLLRSKDKVRLDLEENVLIIFIQATFVYLFIFYHKIHTFHEVRRIKLKFLLTMCFLTLVLFRIFIGLSIKMFYLNSYIEFNYLNRIHLTIFFFLIMVPYCFLMLYMLELLYKYLASYYLGVPCKFDEYFFWIMFCLVIFILVMFVCLFNVVFNFEIWLSNRDFRVYYTWIIDKHSKFPILKIWVYITPEFFFYEVNNYLWKLGECFQKLDWVLGEQVRAEIRSDREMRPDKREFEYVFKDYVYCPIDNLKLSECKFFYQKRFDVVKYFLEEEYGDLKNLWITDIDIATFFKNKRQWYNTIMNQKYYHFILKTMYVRQEQHYFWWIRTFHREFCKKRGDINHFIRCEHLRSFFEYIIRLKIALLLDKKFRKNEIPVEEDIYF